MERRVQEINKQYVRRKRWHKIWSMMAALAAFCTTYVLILPAITMSRQLVCEQTEHRHTESCYAQQSALICGREEAEGHTHIGDCYLQQSIWICGLEESDVHSHSEECYGVEQVLQCELPEAENHGHSEICYESQEVLTCTMEEHTHSEFCYDAGPADANADVETQEDWERSLSSVELSGNRAEDVIAVAMSQLGYRESNRNYVLADEVTLNGYTRYGGWYGNPYGDWDAMFASFVLHYAGVDDLGRAEDPAAWAQQIAQEFPQQYRTAGEYDPVTGELVFFDRDQDGEIDGVGILVTVSEDSWQVIEGNTDDAVSLVNYALGDSRVVAYGLIPVPENAGQETVGETEEPLLQQTDTQETDKKPADDQTEESSGGSEESMEYTVTYVANNGTEQTMQQQVSGAATLFWDGMTVPEGMSFNDWNTADDGSGNVYANGAALELTEDLTVYAQWKKTAAETEKAAEYTITYMANNGTEETMQQKGSSVAICSGDEFTVPEGMFFIGWNTAPDGSGTDYDEGVQLTLTEDMTLYAQWVEASVSWGTFDLRSTDAAAASTEEKITISKQIEWTGEDADDYSYRLHLTLDGSSLSAGSVTTVEPTEKRRIGILLDVTETMLSTSVAGSTTGENKFEAVQKLLEGADGFLASLLDGNTYVSVIVVGGDNGSDYKKLTDEIAAGDKPGDFSNINNSLHMAQGISYVSGLKAAEDYLGQNIDSLVYIVGNETDTYIKYSDGRPDRTVSGSAAETANYNDYVTFMNKHPELSMYMLYVTPKNRGSDVAEKMGAFSVERGTGGGYYEAGDVDSLKQQLEQIAQQIVVPGDKTTNITIRDALSSNVALADNVNLTATLTLLNSDGTSKPTTDIRSYVTASEDAVTCNYTEKIEGPFKIEIAFNIKTADGIYQPYTVTGDANTDWDANATSSGQPGFFSNGEATASYTLNDTSGSQTFTRPVVQAPEKATIELTKTWVDALDEDKQPVTVELRRGAADGELVGTVVLSQDNSWTASCDVKILTAEGTSNQIFIAEQAVDGFTASYSADNVSVAANGTHPVTVTNTKQVVEKNASLTVNKLWQSVSGSQEAVIHVCTYDGVNTYADIEGSPFTVTGGQEGSKTFTITWTGETPPVICVYEEHNDAFYPVLTGDGAEKNIPLGGYQVSAMQLTPEESNAYLVTLTNLSSVQMPETGGPGTHLYVFGGFTLIFSALLLMHIQKRKIERRARGVSFR